MMESQEKKVEYLELIYDLIFVYLIGRNNAILHYVEGVSIAYVPILFGIIATALSGKVNMLVPVDFMHLSERAMLYVVFTFGEMIISITPYFEENISANLLYFSAMAFLIVVGLFYISDFCAQ